MQKHAAENSTLIFKRRGQKLRQIREELKLKVKDIANILGMSEDAIYDYEIGRRRPNMEYILYMANLGHYSIASILEVDREITHDSAFTLPAEDEEFWHDFYMLSKTIRNSLKTHIKVLREATHHDK